MDMTVRLMRFGVRVGPACMQSTLLHLHLHACTCTGTCMHACIPIASSISRGAMLM
jgi:hypothetical protein